ncbi:hypothetical protein BofuT4_uP074320.1 [Botrytis cinerea T4]|uniref:Uncharacterized protein n=1 Tax=Botryotinia fuckeliana (strain T4) TaxID=999810 RepID=G2XP24_BOTF4|nr:hypothetical protein BofuT4_uP074320.1 [Botrytis cinerea T4]
MPASDVHRCIALLSLSELLSTALILSSNHQVITKFDSNLSTTPKAEFVSASGLIVEKTYNSRGTA